MKWMEAGRNIPHCNQETNNLVESYHSVMKGTRFKEKARTRMRMDTLVHKLRSDVFELTLLKLKQIESGKHTLLWTC